MTTAKGSVSMASIDAGLDGAPVARPRGRRKLRLGLYAARLGILTVLLAAWEYGVSQADLAFFSRPSIVFARVAELVTEASFYANVRITLLEIVIGYAIGAAAGLVLGFALGRSKFLSDLFQPFIIAIYSVPKIALAPLFIVWLGLGIQSKIAVVVLATFFLVFFNTYSGLQNINEELVRLARLMGASWRQTVGRVIVPAAANQIFIGLKSAVPFAVIGAVIGEYIGSSEGLGHFILYSAQTYDAPSLFAGIVALVLIVFSINTALDFLERRVIRWRQAERQTVHF